MRILHVVPSFGLGGMERIVCALINHTSSVYEHIILALADDVRAAQWLASGKTQVVALAKNNVQGKYFKTLYNSLRMIQPTMLMTYNWGATDAIWLGRLAGIRYLIHCEHGFNVDESEITLWKRDVIRFFVYRLASKVVVVSHDLQTMLRQKYLLKASRVVQVPNGIDTTYYSPNFGDRQRIRKQLGFTDADVVVGFSGRLDPVKNFPLLTTIFVESFYSCPQLRLLIVGDGPERSSLENFFAERNLHKAVAFAGSQEDVLPYLRAMDVFLLTSLREQMPLTILEAMAVGIPVIASSVGEIPQIVTHDLNGFVHHKQASPKVFAHSLLALLSSDRRKKMGEAARKKVVEHFQQNTMVQRYETVIHEVLGEASMSVGMKGKLGR
jgi:sugar transferase (PEP-CTERM/EpsH1 system associated)